MSVCGLEDVLKYKINLVWDLLRLGLLECNVLDFFIIIWKDLILKSHLKWNEQWKGVLVDVLEFSLLVRSSEFCVTFFDIVAVIVHMWVGRKQKIQKHFSLFIKPNIEFHRQGNGQNLYKKKLSILGKK